MALFTYSYPVSGTTPPTAAQMNIPGAIATMITGRLNMLDADTTITITHNYGLSLAEQSNLFPMLAVENEVVETAASFVVYVRPTPTATPANTFTVGKASGAGTGFTSVVFILRPHTLIQ
jgi:hypothetical protein